jgi:hypothetical protein
MAGRLTFLGEADVALRIGAKHRARSLEPSLGLRLQSIVAQLAWELEARRLAAR